MVYVSLFCFELISIYNSSAYIFLNRMISVCSYYTLSLEACGIPYPPPSKPLTCFCFWSVGEFRETSLGLVSKRYHWHKQTFLILRRRVSGPAISTQKHDTNKDTPRRTHVKKDSKDWGRIACSLKTNQCYTHGLKRSDPTPHTVEAFGISSRALDFSGAGRPSGRKNI